MALLPRSTEIQPHVARIRPSPTLRSRELPGGLMGGRLYVGPHGRSDIKHRCVCMRSSPTGSHRTALMQRARDVRVCMRTSPTGPSRTYSINLNAHLCTTRASRHRCKTVKKVQGIVVLDIWRGNDATLKIKQRGNGVSDIFGGTDAATKKKSEATVLRNVDEATMQQRKKTARQRCFRSWMRAPM